MEHKITAVARYKGETVQVDFEDRDPIFLHCSVIYDLGLRQGMCLSEKKISEAVRRNDIRRARERALYLLDNRDYGYVEMFKKLSQNYDEEVCYAVVNGLASAGLIDDRRYAEKCAEYYVVTKQRGCYRAAEEMRRRGIPKELIDEALEKYDGTAPERLKDLIERKYLRKLNEPGGAEKVKAALVRQGYGFSEINALLKEYEEYDTEED